MKAHVFLALFGSSLAAILLRPLVSAHPAPQVMPRHAFPYRTYPLGTFVVSHDPDPSVDSLPLPHTLSDAEYQRRLYRFFQERRYDAPSWGRDKEVRDTGPWIDGKYYGTHDAVRIFYSPEVMRWLEGGRRGRIPDGAMIVKEMFAPPAARHGGAADSVLSKGVSGIAVMVRDSAGSKDGWYWSYWGPGQEVDAPARYPYNYPNSGFGLYCVRCHASAASEFTFSSLRNVAGFPGDPIVFRVDDSWRVPAPTTTPEHASHRKLARPAKPVTTGPLATPDPAFAKLYAQIATIPLDSIERIPSVAFDHVVAGPDGPGSFLTSDQCLSCHDGQPGNLGPNMYIPASSNGSVNLSPYGEWNWSMMGLSGRDPIFYAQLESERALQPRHEGKIQDLCFTCHGVMGQRQFTSDHPGELFAKEYTLEHEPQSPHARYGALARDGVSCTVCHQIVDDHGPLDSIVTGRFHMSSPGENEPGMSTIYGPFDKPATLPMRSSLGMTPVKSDYISTSRLCASCHTVRLPIFDRAGTEIGQTFEQTTYLEWLNSAYQNEVGKGGATPMTCQNCHMPDRYPDRDGAKLAFRIANIQDGTYPDVDNRAPLDSLDVVIREGFARHTLLGINIFALEMFRQFDSLLGVRRTDYMTGSNNGLPTAIDAAQRQASKWSARVEILETSSVNDRLRSRIKVTNLTGHRLPSGVGFRRAFLEFTLRDRSGRVLWSSGRTNDMGVIIDDKGLPLPSEFREVDPASGRQAYQPHHQKISHQDQAQVYEELIVDPEGTFTTSFLNLFKHVKDNRLLPIGWSRNGPPGFAYASETMPHGEALDDPAFLDGSGSDIIDYDIRLPRAIPSGSRITATLYYQSIPPAYLRDRFATAPGKPDTRRLHAIAGRLDLKGTHIENWKLPLASATTLLNAPSKRR